MIKKPPPTLRHSPRWNQLGHVAKVTFKFERKQSEVDVRLEEIKQKIDEDFH